MADPVAEADLVQKRARSSLQAAVVGASDQGGHQNIFHNRALRQQVVILENESNSLVTEGGQILLVADTGRRRPA